jgi:hypothetical protein
MIELEKELEDFYDYFLRSLDALADDENPGKVWSTELYEDFFSPYECVVTWKTLSEQQRNKLRLLADMVEDYEFLHPDGREKTDEEIRNDPEWDKIREFAKAVYKDLKDVKYE